MKLSVFIILIFINRAHSATYKCDSTIKCGCSNNPTVTVSKIIGGEESVSRVWDWIVSLQKLDSHICGATLLTLEYAVTAAHCVRDKVKSELSIVAGSNHLLDTNTQKRRIIDVTIHPNYNSLRQINDIAILKFSPLNTSLSNIRFICLPERGQDPFQIGSNVVAIGWGVTTFGNLYSERYLRQVTLQTYSSTSTDCQRSGIAQSNIQFCAGSSQGGKDTCQGDSGGPLMAFVNNRWVLAGITSFGKGCAIRGYPGVYTRVSAFIPYINSTIGLSVDTSRTSTVLSGSYGRLIYHLILIMLSWLHIAT